jgi:DNA topoisomerase I
MTQIEQLQQTGYRRVGSPKRGFRWQGAPKRELQRIDSLRVPPAWTEVVVSRKPGAKLLAVGRDKKGRWQYRYSEAAVRRREEKKFDKLIAFGAALPKLRAAIDKGLRLQGLQREKVMACILRILSTCFLRPGSQVYARENGSFGIATLQNRHAMVSGDTVRFQYRGKGGKEQACELCDRRVARVVRALQKLAGKDLFQYLAEDGSIVNIRRRLINDDIKEVMGERFSAKDFRTWAGTLIAAGALARMNASGEIVEGRSDRRRMMVAAVKETAAQLGNTPAVCRASYIWPSVLHSFEKGTVVSSYFETMDELIETRSRGQRAAEKALLELIKTGRSALPSPKARRLSKAFNLH